VPLNIQAIYSLKGLLSQDSPALFRFDGLPGYLLEDFGRHKDGGTVRIHSHQESSTGWRLAMRTNCMLALDK
jgi:hypothetical protein